MHTFFAECVAISESLSLNDFRPLPLTAFLVATR